MRRIGVSAWAAAWTGGRLLDYTAFAAVGPRRTTVGPGTTLTHATSSVLESHFHAIVSGQRRGAGASLARGMLGCLELPYAAAVRWRNRRYDQNPGTAQQVGVPVVSVGNLTLGGTGKTPMVKWIARWLRQRGTSVALISRGYGGADGRQNDEALELEQALPGVPHLQNPDRVAAAEQAIAEHGTQALLLDDAFQHRRIARDLDIVLLDATEPFGFGRVFPRGLLREPASGLGRADVVCLTRANLVETSARERIREQARRLAPNALWCEASHAPHSLLTQAGECLPLTTLAGKRVAAFCGIGNPAAFRRTLEAAECEVAVWREFPDHHRYTPAEQAEVARLADSASAELLVCTHKDLVKLNHGTQDDPTLCAVVVGMSFESGETAFTERLEASIASN